MSPEHASSQQTHSVGPKAARGAVWTMGLTTAQRLIHLARTIIVAQLLLPRDFGLMGVALLCVSFLETFSKTGFEAALIQRSGRYETYLDTAWSIEILRALLLACLLVLGAPAVAGFFGESEAVAVLRVTAIVMILKVLVNPMVISFHRDLKLGRLFLLNMTGLLAGTIVTVGLAIALRNVWALVLGTLATALTTLIVSYSILPYRPRFRIQLSQAKELFGYGKWVLASFVLRFLSSEGDDVLVGGLLGVVMLGYYQMAYRISHAPVTHFTHSLFNVLFPAYTKLKDDLPRLRNAYVEVLKITCLLTVPVVFGIILLARDFTVVVLGRKWLPIVEPMQVLCVAGVAKAVSETAEAVFYALGKPRIDTRWKIVQLVVLAALIVPLIKTWDLSGAALAVLISTLPPVAGRMQALAREAGLDVAAALRALAFPLACSAVMSICIYLAKTITADASELLRLSLGILVGATSYLGSVLCLDELSGFGIRRLFLHRVGHLLGS